MITMQLVNQRKELIKEVPIPLEIQHDAIKLGEFFGEYVKVESPTEHLTRCMLTNDTKSADDLLTGREMKAVVFTKQIGSGDGKAKGCWQVIEDINITDLAKVGKIILGFLKDTKMIGLKFVRLTFKDLFVLDSIKKAKIDLDTEIDKEIFKYLTGSQAL